MATRMSSSYFNTQRQLFKNEIIGIKSIKSIIRNRSETKEMEGKMGKNMEYPCNIAHILTEGAAHKLKPIVSGIPSSLYYA